MSNSNILFDPHCEVGQNVKSVTANVRDFHGHWKCYIIPFGPVYHNTLKVKQGDVLLKEGIDYYVGHRYIRGTHITARSLIGSIWSIKDGITGALTIEGHSIGGDYVMSAPQIADYIENRFTPPDVATWEDVMNGDKFFPPVKIKFDIEAWYGETALIEAVNQLSRTIESIDNSNHPLWQVMNDRFNRLLKLVNDSKWQEHLASQTNPHKTRNYHIGALHESASAVNSLKVFGKDIAQLTEYVAEQGIAIHDLAPYIVRAEENYVNGDIVFEDNHAIIRGSDKLPRATIDLSSGNIKLVTAGNITIGANKDNLEDGGSWTFKCGDNVLELRRTPGASTSSLYYNGDLVINAGNFKQETPERPIPVFDLHYKDTDDIKWSGMGTVEDPLTAVATPPKPTASGSGVVKLTSDWDVSEHDIVATPKLVELLHEYSNGRVDGSTTVNDLGLLRDIWLTKLNIGLGSIDNTSDVNKSLSFEAMKAIDGKAVIGHTHPITDILVGQATDTKYGGARGDDGSLKYADPDRGLLSCVATRHWDLLINQKLSIKKSLPASVINAKKFLFQNDGEFTFNGDVITATQPSRYYSNRRWFDIPAQSITITDKYPKPWRNKVFYLYVTGKRGVGSFILEDSKQPDDVYKTWVARFFVTGGDITKYELKDTVLRLGEFREMQDHMNDRTAHNFGTPTIHNYHLEQLTNRGCAHTREDVVSPGLKYVSAAAWDDIVAKSGYRIKTGTIMTGEVLTAYDSDFPPHFVAAAAVPRNTVDMGWYGMQLTTEMVNNKPKFTWTGANTELVTPTTAVHYLLVYLK